MPLFIKTAGMARLFEDDEFREMVSRMIKGARFLSLFPGFRKIHRGLKIDFFIAFVHDKIDFVTLIGPGLGNGVDDFDRNHPHINEAPSPS